MKRFFDFVGAAIALVVFILPMLLIAVIVRFKLGSPIIFVHKRPGKNGKPFNMLKFRTMTDERDADGVLLSNSLRLTPFGKALRSASLDELPELFNVLIGDMSLVGPRPLLLEYLSRYSAEQARRHEVKPGITGLAQINGRNAISWKEKFALDVWYVDNQSFFLDIKILILTFKKVILREGINASEATTMKPFLGDKAEGTKK